MKKKIREAIIYYLFCISVTAISLDLASELIKAVISKFDEIIEEEDISIEIDILEEDSEFSTEKYADFFRNYDIEYEFSDYLITEEEVSDIFVSNSSVLDCSFVSDYDVDSLYEKIKKNSFDYLDSNSSYKSCFIDDSNFLVDNMLYQDQVNFEDVFREVLKKYFETATNNVNEDVCKMQDLKIVFDDNLDDRDVLGRYDDEENVIYLYRKNIRCHAIVKYLDYLKLNNIVYSDISKYDFVTFIKRYFYETIVHEGNHMRSDACNCRTNNGTNSFSISYKSDAVSSLMEFPCESEIYNLDKEYKDFSEKYRDTIDNISYSYGDLRDYESLTFLLALFNSDSCIDDYYNAIFDTDVVSLMHFFELDTKDERYDYFRALYSFDASCFRNNFINEVLSNEDLESYSESAIYEILDNIRLTSKNDIFRMFLSKLVEYTEQNKDFDLYDNLMLFNIIKSRVIGNDILSCNEDFIRNFFILEYKYYGFLCNYYDVSLKYMFELEIDLASYGATIVDLLMGNSVDNEYVERAKSFVDRFPLLENILFVDGYYISNHYLFFDLILNLDKVDVKLYVKSPKQD